MSSVNDFLKSETEIVRAAFDAHGVFSGIEPRRVPTGFPCVDMSIGGMTPGELIVAAARPGVGKSTYLLHQMRAARALGFKTGMISLEDSEVILGERIQAYHSRFASLKVRRFGYKHPELKEVLTRTDTENMVFAFPKHKTMDEISIVMYEMAQKGVNVVTLDYLTAIIPSGGSDLRTSYSMMVNELTSLARQHGMVLVLAAQVARPTYNQKTGSFNDEPFMNELGETSFLERAADICLMLWKQNGSRFGKLAKTKFGGPEPRFKVTLDEKGLYRTEVIDEI